MSRRAVKKLTIEYEDGEIEVFNGPIQHVIREDYPRGVTTTEKFFLSHQIFWQSDIQERPNLSQESQGV